MVDGPVVDGARDGELGGAEAGHEVPTAHLAPLLEGLEHRVDAGEAALRAFPERGLIRRHPRLEEHDNELRLLEQNVAAASGQQEAMALLAQLMSPEVHHTAAGLMATRMYTQLFDA